eukprot:gene6186-7417_t
MAISKKELVAKVADKTEISVKDVGPIINATLEVISESLLIGEKVSLIGCATTLPSLCTLFNRWFYYFVYVATVLVATGEAKKKSRFLF